MCDKIDISHFDFSEVNEGSLVLIKGGYRVRQALVTELQRIFPDRLKGKNIAAVFVDPSTSIETIDAETMEHHGWVKK